MRISAVLLVKFLRNPQFCAIGNIFYSLEPFCSLELYEETVQLASYEFLLDFHIFQASLCTSKGIGNRVSCILAIFLYIAGVHSADMGLNPRIAEKKKSPVFHISPDGGSVTFTGLRRVAPTSVASSRINYSISCFAIYASSLITI